MIIIKIHIPCPFVVDILDYPMKVLFRLQRCNQLGHMVEENSMLVVVKSVQLTQL